MKTEYKALLLNLALYIVLFGVPYLATLFPDIMFHIGKVIILSVLFLTTWGIIMAVMEAND
jgi:hypothetical protein